MIIEDIRPTLDLSEYRKHLRESENIKPSHLLDVLFCTCMFVILIVILSI